MKVENRNFFKEIAEYYDSKREDLNLLLAQRDKIVHHHSGICSPNAVFPYMTESKLLEELHLQETALTFRGISYLGNITPNMYGLDAGCGRGGSSFIINRQFGCKIEGITLSKHQAKFASEVAKEFKVEDSVRFHRANMLDMPFPSFTFNFIWACESTEHIPDLERMFKEFNRAGKKDCRLIIIAGCANPKHPKAPKFIRAINEWYHMCIHSSEEYLKLADKQGWQLETNLDLTPETIPYWDLRVKSQYKTGVEELNWAYKIGAGEYRFFAFQKKSN